MNNFEFDGGNWDFHEQIYRHKQLPIEVIYRSEYINNSKHAAITITSITKKIEFFKYYDFKDINNLNIISLDNDFKNLIRLFKIKKALS